MEKETDAEIIARLTAENELQKQQIIQLTRDANDMLDSGSFTRCKECRRIHVRGYICPFCGAQ